MPRLTGNKLQEKLPHHDILPWQCVRSFISGTSQLKQQNLLCEPNLVSRRHTIPYLQSRLTYTGNLHACIHTHSQDCNYFSINCRSTPVETLHTILLRPYKYLTRKVMTELSPRNKEEVLARMAAFCYSGFKNKVYGNITRYCKSFVGRDFKAWAQMALFIITPYLSEEEATVWLNLTKVHV